MVRTKEALDSLNLSLKSFNPNSKTIAICVPAYGTLTVQWFIGFLRFVMYNAKKYNLKFLVHEEQPVSICRNELVETALKISPDYIFFIDSDNLIPDKALDKLIEVLEGQEADVVSGVYFSKDAPHYPVLRSARSGGFWKVEDLEIGQIIPIDACGLGCVLIRPDVFKKIEKPWFVFSHEKWAEKDVVISEDLFFCRKVKQAGMKILCHSGVVSAHIGGIVELMEFFNYEPIRKVTMLDREDAINDLMSFTGEDRESLDVNIVCAEMRFEKAWKELKDREDRIQFWKNDRLAVYQQFGWHFDSRRAWDLELITRLKRFLDDNPGKEVKVLDFSIGIGQNALMMARMGFKMTIADLEGQMLDLAESRFKRAKIGYKKWVVDKEESPEKEYDIILVCDVFQYMDRADFRKYFKKLMSLKRKDTQVIMTHSLGYKVLDFDSEVVTALEVLSKLWAVKENINTANHWDAVWNKEGLETGRTYPEKFQRITDYLNKELNNDSEGIYDVLDIGCGVGVLLRKVIAELSENRVVNGYGIDISESAVNLMVHANPFIKGYVAKFPEEQPIKNRRFDAILCTEFLEHMSDEQVPKLFENVKNMMKEESVFICSVPNDNMPKELCAEHEQEFDKEKFKDLLDQHFNDVMVEVIRTNDWEYLIAFCKDPKTTSRDGQQ